MDKLPPQFRAKYEQLSSIIDSRTGKPAAQSLGAPCNGLENYPSGGQRFNFYHGDISSFDHTGRYPVVAIFGQIYNLYYRLGGIESALGRPLTDVQDLPDGTRCAQFEGGHVHEIGDKAQPFPAAQCTAPIQAPIPPFPFGSGPANMPAQLHQKWVELSYRIDPFTNQSIAEMFGAPCHGLAANPLGGQTFSFYHGMIVSQDANTPPFGVWGPIYGLYYRLGQVESGWGRPLTDEQDTADGGRCSVFEGGHIHRYGDKVYPVKVEDCTALAKPSPRSAMFGKMPPQFQKKWSQLATIIHPITQTPIVEMMGSPCHGLQENPSNLSGQHFNFYHGHLVAHTTDTGFQQPAYGQYGQPPIANEPPSGLPIELTSPYAIYGGINDFWYSAGGFESTYGRPICDEQGTTDGGRCSIFEGGHIHWYNGEARAFPADQCTAPHQPKGVPMAQPSYQPPPPVYGAQQQQPYQDPTGYAPPAQPSYPQQSSQPQYQQQQPPYQQQQPSYQQQQSPYQQQQSPYPTPGGYPGAQPYQADYQTAGYAPQPQMVPYPPAKPQGTTTGVGAASTGGILAAICAGICACELAECCCALL